MGNAHDAFSNDAIKLSIYRAPDLHELRVGNVDASDYLSGSRY
jgi:hypothetical protein